MRRLFDALTSSQSQSEYVGKNVKVGKYSITIESVIAEGGFAIVYCAKINESKGGKCALKRMFVNDEDQLAVCQREIRLMKELNGHKNIVRYMAHMIKKQPTGVYEILLLIEYCSRGHVLDLMNKRLNSGFNESEILHIFSDVCQAISRLHFNKVPIAHRDLKVENILINDSNNYVLCDFGSATQKILEPDKIGVNRVEEEITRFTTVQYRSPEMVDLYSGYPIGLKADIWALGVLLYHLCFFNLPFSTSLSIQAAEVAIPDNSPFSESLHKLMHLCLQTNPKDRPDIWQLGECVFQIMKKPNPIQNQNQLEPINLTHVSSLPTQTQLNNLKLQTKNQPNKNQAQSSYSAQSVKSINASTNPQQLVDKADEALNILKEQMKKIKLEYDSLSTNDQRRVALESEAARIKSNYLKIQEVRRTNFTKLQVPNSYSKLSSSPSLPSQFSSIQAAQNPLPAAGRSVGPINCVGTIEQRLYHMTQDMTHRRAISDPSSIDTILNYQKSINGDRSTLSAAFPTVSFDSKCKFGSDSTIDSQVTVRYGSPAQDDDSAFDAFLAERKHTTQELVPTSVSQNDNGPVYRSLNTNSISESENIENGGWVHAPEDDSSSASSTSSSSASSETERQHLEEQLIQSSDESNLDNSDAFHPKLRSKTLPEIYACQSRENVPNDDPFMMAPFPACPTSSQVHNRDRDQSTYQSFSKKSISDKNPFKRGSSYEKSTGKASGKTKDPFEQAPFHA
jgi:serine/threonine protein kinase